MSVLDEKWELGADNGGGVDRIELWKSEKSLEVVGEFYGDAKRIRLAALAPRMAKRLLALEWSNGRGDGESCPSCGNEVDAGHHAHCDLGPLCDELREIAKGSEESQ